MKHLIGILLLIVSTAQAGVRTDSYADWQRNSQMECPLRFCALDDYAHTFVNACSEQRERTFDRTKLPVMIISDLQGRQCWCNCSFAGSVRRKALQGWD